MDMGKFNLFIKLIKEEYRLSDMQISKLSRRLLSDDREFERVWEIYQSKSVNLGVDGFKNLLQDLLH